MAQLPDLPGQPVPRVLDLGCGDAACANAVKQRWPEARIMGIDRHYGSLRAVPSFVCALQSDVRALPFDQPVFSLILIRHPDVFRRPDAWQTAISAASRLLQSNGCLLITCYSLPEAELINGWMRHDWPRFAQAIPFRRDVITPADLVDHDRFAFAWQLRRKQQTSPTAEAEPDY